MGNVTHILLVEDNPSDALLLRETLGEVSNPRFEITHVETIQAGASLLKDGNFDVVLLDLHLPDCSGLEGIDRLNASSSRFPIIVLTGMTDDESLGIDAVRKGAQDFIVKSRLTPQLLASSIRYAMDRKKITERLAILGDVASKLLASDKPQQVVHSLCQRVMSHLNCHVFFNYLIDSGRKCLHLNACEGVPEDVAKRIEWLDLGAAICGCAAMNACRIVAENIQMSSDSRADLVRSFGVQAYACHPLVNQGVVIGTLSFGSCTRATFSESDLDLMRNVSEHVSIAMQRMKLMAETSRIAAEAQVASQTKSQFLANISHELRTPMTAILGMADLALEEELTPVVRDYLETLKDSGNNLLTLLNEILDLSRIESGKLVVEREAFDLRSILELTVRMLAVRAHSKNLELILKFPHSINSQLIGDPLRVRQIIINLVGNAIKFTPSGHVVVELSVEDESDDEISVKFKVEDTGIGISREKQEEIFSPFIQADSSTTRKFGGTGLGLAIASNLARLMGGRLWVESEVGVGSRFFAVVKFLKQKDIAPEPQKIAILDQKGVLVIENQASLSESLKETLEFLGMRPLIVPDVKSARASLAKLETNSQEFAFVIVDRNVPGLDRQFVDQMLRFRSKHQLGILLMISSTDAQVHKEDPMQLAADAILLKPPLDSELQKELAKLIKPSGSHAFSLKPANGAVAKQAHYHALLAEDTLATQKLISIMLERNGHSVDVAENGATAVEMVKKNDYNLILMDIQMPVMDGYQATEAVRALPNSKKGTPIIALTAHAMKGDRERCLSTGMDAYLAKPIDEKELMKLVNTLCSRSERDSVKSVFGSH